MKEKNSQDTYISFDEFISETVGVDKALDEGRTIEAGRLFAQIKSKVDKAQSAVDEAESRGVGADADQLRRAAQCAWFRSVLLHMEKRHKAARAMKHRAFLWEEWASNKLKTVNPRQQKGRSAEAPDGPSSVIVVPSPRTEPQ